jgi:predicted nuclease of predicted toxin-antitoxin system
MRLKLDENLPATLALRLAALGHDVDTVHDEGLAGHDDHHVWATTQVAQRALITQDLDFSDIRTFAPGTHWGLILVRLREPSRSELAARLLQVFQEERVDQWQRAVVTIADHKVRVRTPRGA